MKKDPFHNSTVFWDTASVFVHHYIRDIRKVIPKTVIDVSYTHIGANVTSIQLVC